MESRIPDIAGVRWLFNKLLRSDSELRAFILDTFGPAEYQSIEGIHNRTALINELLLRHSDNLTPIIEALYGKYPEEFAAHRFVVALSRSPNETSRSAVAKTVLLTDSPLKEPKTVLLPESSLKDDKTVLLPESPVKQASGPPLEATTPSPGATVQVRAAGSIGSSSGASSLRELRWFVILGTLVALIMGLIALTGRSPKIEIPASEIFVLPAPQFEDGLAVTQRRHIPLDTPQEFIRKVQEKGFNEVWYEVTSERDRETRELLRQVLALLKQNNQQIAALSYRQQELTEWRKDAHQQTQLLTKLVEQIEARLETNLKVPRDMGIIPWDVGIPDSIVFVETPQDLAPTLPAGNAPKNLVERIIPSPAVKAPKARNTNEAAYLDSIIQKFQGDYDKGNYYDVINKAHLMQNNNSSRAWRLIGAAACHTQEIWLINNAYRRLDPPGRQYIIAICWDYGIKNTGNQFHLKAAH